MLRSVPGHEIVRRVIEIGPGAGDFNWDRVPWLDLWNFLSAQKPAFVTNAIWAGGSDDSPAVLLDAAQVFVPLCACNLCPESLARRRTGRLWRQLHE